MRTSPPSGSQIDGLPIELGRQPAERPHEEAERAALLLLAEGDPERPRIAIAAAAVGPRSLELPHPRLQQLVGAGEVAPHQVLGLPAARGPGVEAPEEHLHERARHLRREHPLRGLVEAAHVQRPRMAKRNGPCARGERVVHMDEVELHAPEQRVESAREVERDRGGPWPRATGHRQAGADRQHRSAAVAAGTLAAPGTVEERLGPVPGGLDQPPGLAHPATGPRRRGHDDPVPASGQLDRAALDELVDLVAGSPGVRRHLRDRQAFGGPTGHGRSIGRAERLARSSR